MTTQHTSRVSVLEAVNDVVWSDESRDYKIKKLESMVYTIASYIEKAKMSEKNAYGGEILNWYGREYDYYIDDIRFIFDGMYIADREYFLENYRTIAKKIVLSIIGSGKENYLLYYFMSLMGEIEFLHEDRRAFIDKAVNNDKVMGTLDIYALISVMLACNYPDINEYTQMKLMETAMKKMRYSFVTKNLFPRLFFLNFYSSKILLKGMREYIKYVVDILVPPNLHKDKKICDYYTKLSLYECGVNMDEDPHKQRLLFANRDRTLELCKVINLAIIFFILFYYPYKERYKRNISYRGGDISISNTECVINLWDFVIDQLILKVKKRGEFIASIFSFIYTMVMEKEQFISSIYSYGVILPTVIILALISDDIDILRRALWVMSGGAVPPKVGFLAVERVLTYYYTNRDICSSNIIDELISSEEFKGFFLSGDYKRTLKMMLEKENDEKRLAKIKAIVKMDKNRLRKEIAFELFKAREI